MQTDPIQEWRRLTEHYRAMSDEQLEELADDFADLTEAAQQLLRGELRHRGLDRPQAVSDAKKVAESPAASSPVTSGDSAGSAEESDLPHEYTWKTLLCDCNNLEQARQVCEVLRRAGIESWMDSPGIYLPHPDLDLTNPRVLVAADQLDQARMIVASPIPQDVIDESKMTMPEFSTPSCPACGDPEPLLETVDPVNIWQCEACGRQWTDPESKLNEETQPAGS
jgi:hypothetical protein